MSACLSNAARGILTYTNLLEQTEQFFMKDSSTEGFVKHLNTQAVQIDLQPLSDLVLSRKICTSNFFLVVVMVVGMSVATMMSTIVEEATHT